MDSAQEIFKNNIYRRIQLAAAVCVFKSTPNGKTPEAHALELQMRIKTQWLNSTLPQDASSSLSHFNQSILTQQQYLLSSRLFSVVSGTPNQLSDGYSHDFQSFASTNANEYQLSNRFQAYYESLHANRITLANNASFIHAIIQLKALAEVQSTIPMNKYISSIWNLTATKQALGSTSSNRTSQLQSEPLSTSNDSGFHTVTEDCYHSVKEMKEKDSSVTSVASSVLLYIINSYNVDQLLVKSVQAILHQFKAIAYQSEKVWAVSNLDERMNQWMGSVHQQAIRALHSFIWTNNVHADSSIAYGYQECLSFIQEMILHIIKRSISDQEEYYIHENQISLILQISEGTTLWSYALELIFSKIEEFIVKNGDKVHQEEQSSHTKQRNSATIQQWNGDIESSYFLFLLAKTFLASTKRHMVLLRETDNQTSARTSNADEMNERSANTRSIAELWRRHYTVQVSSHDIVASFEDRQGRAKSDVKRWGQILEDSFSSVPPNFSLLLVLISDCVQLLPSFNNEPQ